MYRRLETANMLHSRTVCLHSLHVLVEDGKDLVVENLILSDAVCHFLQWLKVTRQITLNIEGGVQKFGVCMTKMVKTVILCNIFTI